MKQKRPRSIWTWLKPSDIFLILGFWFVGLALLGIVFTIALTQDVRPEPPQDPSLIPQATYTVVYVDDTAKAGQAEALAQAQRWREDAQLVSVTSSWEQSGLDTLGQPSAWRYRFYSPGLKRFYFVTVSPSRPTFGISHAERLRNAPPPVPIDTWSVSSSTALNLWVNHGGAAMLAHLPKVLVVAQLQAQSVDDPLTWTVAGYDPISQQYHTLSVQATSGEVLGLKSSLR